MRFKKEYIVLFLVIAALSSYLILRNPDKTHYRLPEMPDISKADISKIDLSKKGTTIVLTKTGGTWQISPEGYPCDMEKIKNLLGVIEKIKLTEPVSESKNYHRYGLDGDEKITVRSWQGDTLKREFDVGKAASSFRHTFVRIVGDHRVYLARRNFRNDFEQTVDSLRDKTVLSFNQADIREVHVTQDRQTLVLKRLQAPVEVSTGQKAKPKVSGPEKGEALWHGPGGAKVNETELAGLLSTLSSLKCNSYLYDKKKTDLSGPLYTIDLKGRKDYSISVFPKNTKENPNYPAVSSENEYAFELPAWQAEKIMISRDELLKKTEPDETT